MRTILALAALFALAGCKPGARAEETKPTPYADAAQEMFTKVWDMYRVPEFGLFSEYYPGSHKPDLSYFDDGSKKPQETSFLWPMSGIFSSAVMLAEAMPERFQPYLDSMIVAMEMYYDDVRVPAGYQAYPVRFGAVDRYYDDNGLVGIDYIDSYFATGDKVYLEKAKQVMTFIQSGWRGDYGGAVSWLEGTYDQKPACSNGKAMVLALKLYEATRDGYYLTTGKRFYDWVDENLHDKQVGIVWNSLLTSGEPEVQKHAYTYNTGTLLQAAVMLYRFTGEQTYLDNARRLAEGSYDYFVARTEAGVPYFKDMPWFNLVLFRGYHDLWRIDKDTKYVDAMIASLDHAMTDARDTGGLVYHDWTGRSDEENTPKWFLDEGCIPEFLIRTAMIRGEIPDTGENGGEISIK